MYVGVKLSHLIARIATPTCNKIQCWKNIHIVTKYYGVSKSTTSRAKNEHDFVFRVGDYNKFLSFQFNSETLTLCF